MAKPKTALKKKKKDWYEIFAPKDLGGRLLGETISDDSGNLVGRIVSVNLSRVIGDLKKQNVNMDFIITGVKEGKCSTNVKRYWMQPSTIKRMVRSGVDRIDESFVAKTKDGIIVRVKPLLITRSKTKSSIKKALRVRMISEIKKTIENSTYNRMVQSAISFNLQKDLRNQLNKIYPIKGSQIRSLGLESVKDTQFKEPVEKKEEIKEDNKEKPAETKEAEVKKPEKKEAEKPKKIEKKEQKAEEKKVKEDKPKEENAENKVEKKPAKKTEKE